MADEKSSELKIQLTIMDKTTQISYFNFSARRGTNPEGFPASTVETGDLDFSFLYHKDFYDCWKSMMTKDDFVKGKVDFYSPLDKPGSPTKTFEFGGAKIVGYQEAWNENGESQINIQVSAYEIKYGAAPKHVRHWPNFAGPNKL